MIAPLTHQQELADRIARALPDDGHAEPRLGLHFHRHSYPSERLYGSHSPSFCVIAQGSKTVLLGGEIFRYDPAHYLISTMELPVVGEIVDASPKRPYLSFRLELDPSLVTAVMVEIDSARPSQPPSRPLDDDGVKALNVSPLDANLLDATLRLVRLIDAPGEYQVLGPLVIREIVYRLLTGAQGDRMRHLVKLGGHAHRMVRAVERIRRDFAKPLRVEDVANELGMSVSGFHAHFKTATAMSPLQFQKQLRLHEARRLMLNENLDSAKAGFRVGYEDASQFSREYKRRFGKPPLQDIAQLRESSDARTASQTQDSL